MGGGFEEDGGGHQRQFRLQEDGEGQTNGQTDPGRAWDGPSQCRSDPNPCSQPIWPSPLPSDFCQQFHWHG